MICVYEKGLVLLMNAQANFLLLGVVIPVVIGILLLIGRRSDRRLLILLSVGALVLMVVAIAIFGIEYEQNAFAFGYLSPPVSDFVARLSLLHNDVLNLGLLLAIAGWILALHDASRHRKWLWFGVMLVVTVMSYLGAGIVTSELFMREIPFYDYLIRDHFLVVSLVLFGVSFLISALTLVYSLVALPSRDSMPEAAR